MTNYQVQERINQVNESVEEIEEDIDEDEFEEYCDAVSTIVSYLNIVKARNDFVPRKP
tara:strand:- start:30276 stop:30449 length:174 start_codon:yes stop_codon:yes gene_type:complete